MESSSLSSRGRPAPLFGVALRQQLLGGWALDRYVEPEPDRPLHHPLGAAATGMLIYNADGCMSATMMRAGRAPFASDDWFRPSDAELVQAAAFIAYSGRFLVDESARTVAHDIEVSFFPNWIGKRQIRSVLLTADELTLTPASPILSAGRLLIPELHWRRLSRSKSPMSG